MEQVVTKQVKAVLVKDILVGVWLSQAYIVKSIELIHN